MGRKIGVAVAALVMLVPALTHAREPFTGPEVVDVVRSSADVMKVHQWFLRTAMDVDSTPYYVSDGIARYMPASFRASNGQSFTGTLARITGTSSGGAGNPRTGRAFFGGLSLDLAAVDGPKAQSQANRDGYSAINLQGFVFAGAAYKGFIASFGVRFVTGWEGLDANHRFTLTVPGQTVFRPGTPADIQAAAGTEPVSEKWTAAPMLNIHHAAGASLGGAFDVVQRQLPDGTYTAQRTLSALRGLFEPEPWIRELGARYLGVPFLGLDRFAPGVDHWGDHAREAQVAYNQGTIPPPSSDKAQYELPFGGDDLMGTGLRLAGVAAVYPTNFVREVEAAWAYATYPVEAGFRAIAFRRTGSYTGAGEAFIAFNPSRWLRFAISYSYNVPESSTFYPIPNASVLGIQSTIGDSRFARPIVPLLACAKANASRVEAIKNSKCEDGTGVPTGTN